LLNKFIGELYLLGIPLTLAEKRTPEFKFIQDISIWGTKSHTFSADELVAVDGGFMNVLGKALGEIYPQSEFLDVVIFDATGLSRTEGAMKTSVRLVWKDIVVDRERALQIHQYVIQRFNEEANEQIRKLSITLKEFNMDNSWDNVFSATVYTAGNHSLRMPLNDRVSKRPLQRPERRAFKPVCVARCSYKEGALMGLDLICDHSLPNIDAHDWVKIGSIRCDISTTLTRWKQPVLKGLRTPARIHCSTKNTYSATRSVAEGGRTSGQVKVRTMGGSDRVPNQPRNRPGVEAAHFSGETKPLEREFEYSVQEFREKLEATLGKEQHHFLQDKDELQWRDDGVLILFKQKNKRVYITGKSRQVRSMYSVMLPFTCPVGESMQRSRTQGGRGYGVLGTGSMKPSSIYEPSHASSKANSLAQSISSQPSAALLAFHEVRRIVSRPFHKELEMELDLGIGDIVIITHDLDVEDGKGSTDMHRWVHGTNETSGLRGLFPLSCVTEES
jgi:hypothetical protein